jgi:hypothetical protein
VVTPAFSGGEVFIVVVGVLITTEVPLHSPLLFTARQIAIQFVVVVVIVVIITVGDADVFVIIATAFAVPSLSCMSLVTSFQKSNDLRRMASSSSASSSSSLDARLDRTSPL